MTDRFVLNSSRKVRADGPLVHVENSMRVCFDKTFATAILLAALLAFTPALAVAQSTTGVAPTLIPLSGKLLTAGGAPRTGNVLLVISLYDGQADATPRWIEHQVVTLAADGGYSVQFGATQSDGLP